MAKKTTTRKAMLLSLTSLLICAAMLVGTTFAWFTDSVTSGTNRIIAGNLDVELEHKNASGEFVSVTDADNQLWQTAAFSGPTLWEPGAMAVETFKISNKGTLALKYQFNINTLLEGAYSKVTWDEGANYYDLTDVVKMVIADAAPATREAGVALFTNANTQSFSKAQNVALKAAALEPGASATFSVVLYWAPQENSKDNLYNLNNSGWKLYSPANAASAITAHDANDATEDYLFLKPSVTLLATQQTSESDSFDNQYDANATADGNVAISITSVRATATTTAGEPTVITAGSVGDNLSATKATIAANAVAADKEVTLVVEEEQSNDAATIAIGTGENESTAALYFDVSLEDQDGLDVALEENGFIDVELDIGKNLIVNTVNHRTTALTTNTSAAEYYSYNADTGILTLHVTSLSPFSMGYDVVEAKIGDTLYKKLNAAVAAAQDGETVLVLANVTQDEGIIVNKENASFKIDLNGKKLTVNTGSNCNSRAIRIDNGTVEVCNGMIVAAGAGTTSANGTGCYGAFRVEANGVLNAHDLSLTNARPWGLNVKVIGGEATLTRVNITSSYGGGIEVTEADLGNHSQTGTATLTDCNFTQTGYFDHCSSCLSVSGGSTLTINSGSYTSDNYALYVFSSGGVIDVKGGTFSGNKDGVAIIAQIDTATFPQYTGGLTISGGSFSGGYNITSPAYLSISGGTFNVCPSEGYIATNCEANDNGDGTWTVAEVSSITVGGQGMQEGPENE